MSCLRFPARVPAAGDDAAPGSTGLVCYGPGRPIRLLVADDDPRVRTAIAETIALEADLIMVAAAADAAVALALAGSAGPSVALVDVLLPDEATGLALIRSLVQRPGCAVVAMSVRGGLRRAALAAGAVAFVEKGSDIDAVLDAIRAADTVRPTSLRRGALRHLTWSKPGPCADVPQCLRADDEYVPESPVEGVTRCLR
jgi:CheY-like chemotaxis protein